MSKKTNSIINDFELNTDKNIRTSAVKHACNSFKSANTNLKQGNIRKFNISYKKKKDNGACMEIPKNFIKKDTNNKLYFTNKKFKDNKFINVSNRIFKNITNLQLDHDMKILKYKSNYYLIVPVRVQDDNDLLKSNRIIGIDPGIKTFLTGFDSNCNIIEYNIDYNKLNKLNLKCSNYSKLNKRKRKRTFNKIEINKKNLIDEYHWKSIKYILTNYDYIMFGKLDSQGFVKNGKNKKLNIQTNDLKPYLFRQRLLFKANELNKYVKIINERYTTKTCSNCGNVCDVKTSRIYNCTNCNKSYGRDINSAKNILMRGILN
jgi:transposase